MVSPMTSMIVDLWSTFCGYAGPGQICSPVQLHHCRLYSGPVINIFMVMQICFIPIAQVLLIMQDLF